MKRELLKTMLNVSGKDQTKVGNFVLFCFSKVLFYKVLEKILKFKKTYCLDFFTNILKFLFYSKEIEMEKPFNRNMLKETVHFK